jgi:Flp pilus assembly protein TadG
MRHFWFDQRGNIAVLFALAIVPVIGGIGAAVDYSMASAYRTDMQKSLDAAGISLAKIMPASQATLDERGQQFFDANMGQHSLSNIVLKIVPDIATGSLTLSASGLYKPHIAGIIGVSAFQIGTETRVNWARTKLEVALAFDLSSSMASASGGVSKVDVAKEAAGELVDTLFDAVSNDDPERLKISVVPYTSTVNIGTEHKNAAWMDQNGVSSAHWAPTGTSTVGGNIIKPTGATSLFTLFDWLGESWQGCVATRPGALGLNDDAPVSGTPNSLFVPYFAPDEPSKKDGSLYSNLHMRWLNNSSYQAYNSYIDDEDEGGLSCGTIPTSASSANWTAVQKRGCKYKIAGSTSKKKFYKNGWGFWTGPNFMCNANPLLRLTTSKSAVKNKIAQFEALGDTSIFEGVAWAWRTLSPHLPFADGRAYNTDDNTKILVLLTDGNNNWLQLTNPNRSLHAAQAYYVNQRLGSTQNMTVTQANTHLDNTTNTVCSNAKAKGVTIYAVVFSLEGTPIPTAWKDLVIACASVDNGESASLFCRRRQSA